MAATTRIAPPVIIAQAGVDLIDRLNPNNPHYDAIVNATGKAIEQLLAGVLFQRNGSTVLFPSRSRPEQGITHRTDRHGCSCDAARRDVLCWHRVARYLILAGLRRMRERAIDTGNPLPPPTHCYICGDRCFRTSTPADEACYACVNPHCGATVMAVLFT